MHYLQKVLPEHIIARMEGELRPRSTPAKAKTTTEQIRRLMEAEDCCGHFEDGPKFMPAYKMLELYIRHATRQGVTIDNGPFVCLPTEVAMQINDILPAGVYCLESRHAPNWFDSSLRLDLIRDKTNIIQAKVATHTITNPRPFEVTPAHPQTP